MSEIDVYPLKHRDYFFNIITHLDLEFSEVRKILDVILDTYDSEDLLSKQGVSLDVETEKYLYHIEIYGFEIVITSQQVVK